MRKTIFSILTALVFCCSLFAQDGRQRTMETVVQDVLAAMPADNFTEYTAQMADLAQAAPASVEKLASMLKPAEAGANNLVEYAISGVVRYATDPANEAVKPAVMEGIEKAIKSCKDKYNKQFLEAQLRLMQPYEDTFEARLRETYPLDEAKALAKSGESKDQCKALWLYTESLGKKSEKQMLSALKSDDRAVRTTALLAYEDLADDAFYAKVAKMFKKLSPEAKADVVYWIGEKDIESQSDLVYSVLNAGGELGANAIEAVGKLGGNKAAEKLFDMLGGKYSDAAVEALKYVDVDLTEKVTAELPEAEGKRAEALLALASVKRISESAPAVFAHTSSADSDVAEAAVKALAGVVSAADFKAVAKMYDSAKKNHEVLEEALMAAMSQMSDDARYEAVKSYVDSAENPEYFYMAMASAANQDAVDYLKGKYDAGSSKALDALSTIRNESVAPVLLEVADKNQEYIKRYVDIIDANVKNDNPYKCRCYYKALQKATDIKAVNYVIEHIGWVPTQSAFDIAASYLDNPETVRMAAEAAKRIASNGTAEIDYNRLKEVLAKVAEYYGSTGNADDGYAVDEIRKILEKAAPVEKFQLSDEEKALGFEVLFDGTDLSKWVGDKVGYQVINDVIHVTASYGAAKNLYTEKEYTDFVFRFDFCFLEEGVNNGVGIRTPMGVDAAYEGMCEVQVLDHDAPMYADLRPYQVHGSVYGVVPAKRIVHKPLGEWSSEEIRVVGDRVTVTVNGEVIVDANVREACQGHNVAPDGGSHNPYTVDGRNHPGMFNKKGHVGFLGHGEGLRYRNVRILDLSARK